MTTDEQRVFVAEWRGWINIHFGLPQIEFATNNRSMKEWVGNDPIDRYLRPIPSLTLDWLHVCEMQLMRLGNKGHEYILHLWEITGLQKNNGFLLPLPNDVPEINLMIEKIWLLWVAASKEQRLAALVETIKLTSPEPERKK